MGGGNWLYVSVNGAWFTKDFGANWIKDVCWGNSSATCLAVNGPPTTMFVGQDVAYLGALSTGILKSEPDPTANPPIPLGQVWRVIANSPGSFNVISDGQALFASQESPMPFSTATLAAPTVWTHMPSPTVGRHSNVFTYDPTHHILYSANIGGGLWRLVTH